MSYFNDASEAYQHVGRVFRRRPVDLRSTSRGACPAAWTKCNRWHCNDNGRISTNWPGTSLEYRRRAKTFRTHRLRARRLTLFLQVRGRRSGR